MTQKDPHPDSLYIKEVAGHNKRIRKIVQFTSSSTKAAVVMLLAAVTSLVIANTDASFGFREFWQTEVGFVLGGFSVTMSLELIVNDILMAFFFLLIGLEIKYEVTVGELTNIRQAILPIVAAAGGVLLPVVIYLAINAGSPEALMGWGIPTATDIAFALGILSLLGSRVPTGVKVFLTTLAAADDIIAILIIALFYGHSPDIFWLVMVAVVMVALILMNHFHIYSLVPYLLVGVVLWFCVYMSGLHTTISGVLLALVIPSGSRVNLKSFTAWSEARVEKAKEHFEPDEPVMAQKDYVKTVAGLSKVAKHVVPPLTRLEKKLFPLVYFLILPLFALINADVRLVGAEMGTLLMNPALYGVFFGLVLGKPLGIMLFSFVVIKMKIASLPTGANWMHMLGVSILAGIGFTMAIFVSNLAFSDEVMLTAVKLAILAASALAGIAGYLFLWMQAKRSSAQSPDVDEEGEVAAHAASEPFDH